MALHTLGTNSTSSLQCSSGWLGAPPPGGAFTLADMAAINSAIINDADLASLLQGFSYGPIAVIGTGTTASSVTLTSVAGVTGAPVSQIQVGDIVLGIGIPLGTFVLAVAAAGATITLSQAATTSSAGTKLIFARLGGSGYGPECGGLSESGQLFVPNRGVLRVMPTDVLALDNSGWPILISGNSIGYAGSQW